MLSRIFILVCLLSFCAPSYSDNCDINNQSINLPNGMSCGDIKDTVRKIRILVKAAQILVSNVADSDIDLVDKRTNTIPYILNNLFSSDDAIVQVTSLSNKTPKPFPVKDYLENLANLAETKNYSTVKLIFDESTLKFWIKPISENRVVIDIVVFQKFEGCFNNDSKKCYHDFTRKVFHVSQTNKTENGVTGKRIKIDGITAEDTLSYEDNPKFQIQ